MKLQLLYFGLVREKLGRGEEAREAADGDRSDTEGGGGARGRLRDGGGSLARAALASLAAWPQHAPPLLPPRTARTRFAAPEAHTASASTSSRSTDGDSCEPNAPAPSEPCEAISMGGTMGSG